VSSSIWCSRAEPPCASSTDLDFSVRHLADDRAAVAGLLRDAIDGQRISEFSYTVKDHRGRTHVGYDTPFGGVGNLTTKLDIGPAPWLPPDQRGWVPLPIHQAYRLPTSIPVMALTENMAEKVARLTRRTPPRDVYDLVWIAGTSPHSGFDRAAVRRLAVLKNWVDQYGLACPPTTWEPVAGAVPYDPARWLTTRRSPGLRRREHRPARRAGPRPEHPRRAPSIAVRFPRRAGRPRTADHRRRRQQPRTRPPDPDSPRRWTVHRPPPLLMHPTPDAATQRAPCHGGRGLDSPRQGAWRPTA
jgi:hypothetical protein